MLLIENCWIDQPLKKNYFKMLSLIYTFEFRDHKSCFYNYYYHQKNRTLKCLKYLLSELAFIAMVIYVPALLSVGWISWVSFRNGFGGRLFFYLILIWKSGRITCTCGQSEFVAVQPPTNTIFGSGHFEA